MREDGAGSVLILALWTLFFLGALAVAVGSMVAAGLRVAGELGHGTTAYYAARTGVETAITYAAADSNDWDCLTEKWADSPETFRDITSGDGICSVFHTALSDSGASVTNYGLADEERRIHLGKADGALLTSLLMTAGQADPASAASISQAIQDWRDRDDEALTGGSENAYYRQLDPPYDCRSGDFQSVYELLLVRGMAPELFRRIEPYITVFGAGKVNLNTAEPPVLRAMAAACAGGDVRISEAVAARIIEFRKSGRFFANSGPGATIETFAAELGEGERAALAAMARQATFKSSCFRGIAEGARGEGNSRIMFVFDRNSGEKLFWYEH